MNIEKALAALRKNGFSVRYFATAAEAADALCAQVQETSVGIGGSMTVQALGLYERLSQNNTVYWHWKQPAAEARRLAMGAEVYLLSANAVSETGEIVNIDGAGNRVAATLFGHKRVYYLVGVNKLAPSLEGAIFRARNIAAPLNARRLQCQTPCALAEPMRCHDCHSPDRICNAAVVQARPMGGTQTEVFLIGEELGY